MIHHIMACCSEQPPSETAIYTTVYMFGPVTADSYTLVIWSGLRRCRSQGPRLREPRVKPCPRHKKQIKNRGGRSLLHRLVSLEVMQHHHVISFYTLLEGTKGPLCDFRSCSSFSRSTPEEGEKKTRLKMTLLK